MGNWVSDPHGDFFKDMEKQHKIGDVLAEVHAERNRQDDKWGEQNHEDVIDNVAGDGGHFARVHFRDKAEFYKELLDEGPPDWAAILLEEAYEAVAEEDPAKIRAELVQVAAVAVAWIEAIDRRG